MTVREAREAAGMSRESLAHLTGISPRTIYDIEHGLSTPHRSTRNLLALALKVKPNAIDWPTTRLAEAA